MEHGRFRRWIRPHVYHRADSFGAKHWDVAATGGSPVRLALCHLPRRRTTATLQQLGSDFPGDPGSWLNQAYTPDGRGIIVVSQSGRGWIWPATPSAWKQHACSVAGRNLTREEWSRYVTGKAYSRIC